MPFGDSALWAATGRVSGCACVNMFGRATNVDSGVATDLHDGANATTDLDVLVIPTAARVHAIVSTDATDVTGIGTLTLTGQPADTQTVTIGAKVYTFQTTLTDADGNVKIGANASGTIDNLIAAINLAAGAGTTYAASMTANAIDVEAAAGAGDTMTLWDHSSAAIATTDTADNTACGAANTVDGTGARTVRVYGLKTWASKETYEDINLHGAVAVNTANSYVMINRMEVLTKGGTNVNKGVITATAATDSTVSAQINADVGKTLSTVLGVPSLQTAYISNYYGAVVKPAAALSAKLTLLANPEAGTEDTKFVTQHVLGLDTTGTSVLRHSFNPYLAISGPAIIKLQADADAADSDISGGMDVILLDNS